MSCLNTRGREWWLSLALVLCCGLAQAGGKATVEAITENGQRLAAFTVQAGDRWCLVWNHSVAGFEVQDCFVYIPPAMVLERSHQPDFAAGLGHIEGRGILRSDGAGGYWIEHIDEPIPHNRLPLRVGAMTVNHRLEFQGRLISLSQQAAQQRVVIQLSPSD